MPVKDQFGQTHLVMAQVDVDEATLSKVAEETGGKFFRATDTDSLRKIYAEIDRLEKTTHTVKKFEQPDGAVRLGGLPAFPSRCRAWT